VTILKWQEHNPKHKKGYGSFMFYNGFFNDPKVAQLKLIDVMLFIYMLCVASESSSNSFDIHVKSLPKQFRISTKSLQSCLAQLQSLQLVTFQKKPSLIIKYNRIKDKENRIKDNFSGGQKTPTSVPENLDPDLNKKIWDAYDESFQKRYRVPPTRNASVNSIIAQLGKRLGEDAVEVVKFFLTHNDTFYVSKVHSIGLCLKDAEGLRTQWLRGVQVTKPGLKRFENAVQNQELLDAVEKGKI
jgi:hypothetical protein